MRTAIYKLLRIALGRDRYVILPHRAGDRDLSLAERLSTVNDVPRYEPRFRSSFHGDQQFYRDVASAVGSFVFPVAANCRKNVVQYISVIS